MKTSSPAQRYQFLYELPKGADLHNHLNLSILPEAWLQGALGAEQHHGNVFFTRTKLAGCKDTPDPPVLFRTLQRSSYQLLSDCQRGEYEPLTSLTPALRAEWLSALTIDKPGVYYGQCSELCGPKHAYMPIAIEAVTKEAYEAWVTEAQTKFAKVEGFDVAAAATPPAARN